MEKEGERMFLEAIDQLEVAFNNPDVCSLVLYVVYCSYMCVIFYSQQGLTAITYS